MLFRSRSARRSVLATGPTVGGRGTTGDRIGFLTRARRFFWDPRDFKSEISPKYWAPRGGAKGRALHHWLLPQKARWIPQGLRNAGFNLIELPSLRGVFHRSLSLNTWMGWAPYWRGRTWEHFKAAAVENVIRGGIPVVGGGVGYGTYAVGSEIMEWAFQED